MKNRIRRLPRPWAVSLFALASTACGGSGAVPGETGTHQGGLGLVEVTSCEDLRSYVAEVTTESLLGGGWAWGAAEDDGQAGADASGREASPPTDYTDTNVQEAGVDEADIVETDGEHLYVLHDGELVIVDSWPADQTHEVGRVDVADVEEGWWSWGQGMFLDGDRVVTLTQSWNTETFRWGGTRVTVVDVADRSRPKVVHQADIEGWYTDARAIDGQLYLVTTSGFWSWWDEEVWGLCEDIRCYEWASATNRRLARAVMKARLLPRVRAYFARQPLDALLPSIVEDGVRRDAIRCSDVQRPERTVHGGLELITHLDMQAAEPRPSSTAIFGAGWHLYSSQQNLYIAQTSWAWSWWQDEDEGPDVSTVIHKLSLPEGGGRPVYEATGRVPGWTLDQFSMSEKDGRLRVATTDALWWGSEDEGNSVFVLSQQGGELVETGALRGLSPGQQIYAVRFLGDMGYLVTFQQIDPLHVIDLSDPKHPVERGQLEIPGFSTYLHPMGDGILLAIGTDGEWALQLSMFDVHDPGNPIRIHQQSLNIGEWWGWSEAMWDHHAFTFHPERKILALPVNVYDYERSFTGSIVYRVSEDRGFEELGRVDHVDLSRQASCPEWYTDEQGVCYGGEYRWWVQMRRNVFIEDNLYSISSAGLRVDDLYEPGAPHASVAF